MAATPDFQIQHKTKCLVRQTARPSGAPGQTPVPRPAFVGLRLL